MTQEEAIIFQASIQIQNAVSELSLLVQQLQELTQTISSTLNQMQPQVQAIDKTVNPVSIMQPTL